MQLADFKNHLNEFRRQSRRRAAELQDPYRVVEDVRAFYESCDIAEREMADSVFADWVRAGDETDRYVAQHMIKNYNIVSAVPALATLERRLLRSDSPGAPFEVTKVREIVAQLAQRQKS